MDYITESLSADRIIGSESTQLVQEGDIVLRDNQPDIDVVLKCDAQILPTEHHTEENRLSYSGKIIITLLYLGKDKAMHSTQAEAMLNDFISINGSMAKMYSDISANIINTECKKLNDRKVSWKIVADMKGSVTESTEIEAVTELSNIPKEQQLFDSIDITRTLCSKSDCFNVTEEITLPATKLPIENVLSLNCNITNPEFMPQADSVDMSGDISIAMVYTSAEGGFPEIYEFDLPFSVSFEAENTDVDSILDVKPYIKDCFYDITENVDGEPRIINMDLNICADIKTGVTERVNLLKDAYCLNKNIEFETTPLCYSNTVCRNRGQCPLKETISLDEKAPDMLQILRATGKVYIDDTTIYENKVVIDGIVAIDILYITGNDSMPIYSYSDTIPFSQTIDARGAKEGMEADVNAEIAHIGFNMLSDRELEVRCALNTSTVIRELKCHDIITGVSIDDLLKDIIDKIPTVAIYVVKKGDTLWNLAKKFNTTVKSIADINNIENPDLIYPNQRLIIVKRSA